MIKTAIHTKSGYEIAINTFKPETPGDTVVLILPANGSKQVFYSGFALFLKKNNIIVYTFDYGGIGQSKSAALQWRKWCLSPNYLFDHLDGHETWYDKIDCPLISYSVENDPFAPKESVDWFTNRYTCCSKKRVHINPADLDMEYIGHSGFFKESNRDTLWPMLLNEIEG